MKEAVKYINDIIGLNVTEKENLNFSVSSLPTYITQSYKLSAINVMDRDIVLAEQINEENYTVLQTYKQLEQIKKCAGTIVVLVLKKLQSYTRKRLIEKRINFIVPNKQLYLPEMLIFLNESFKNAEITNKNKLLPSSQYLLIFHLIGTYSHHLEELSFKEIAQLLDYTPMAITNAVNELKEQDLIEVTGEKEKYINFKLGKKDLWKLVLMKDLFETPVLKTVFIDELPEFRPMLKSNLSALSEYTTLNPSRQQYYAVDKKDFYRLQRDNKLKNENSREGEYAIEVWKYKPEMMVYGRYSAVDPLSLYLSLKGSSDERIQMALEQLIQDIIW